MKDDDALPRHLNLLAAMALGLSDRIRAATEAAIGAGASIPAALVQIGSYPGETLQLLQASLGLSQPATTRVVDTLVARGWVQRGRGSDARQAVLTLSSDGAAAMTEVLRHRGDVLRSILGDCSAAEEQVLERLSERALRRLTRTRNEADHVCRLCDIGACPQNRCPAEHFSRI